MKKTEIIDAAKDVEAAVEEDVKKVRGWIKRAMAWLKSLSFKTQASIVVGIAVLSGLMFAVIVAARAPHYVTASQANAMLAEHEAPLNTKIKTLTDHVSSLDADVHALDSRVKELEAKPEPAKITTGSIPKKTVKKPARKPASKSWFSLP